MSDADSADEDHTVDVAAQLSTLLKPINKKMKAMARRMEEAEAQLKRVAAAQAEELPALRSTVESEASSLATRIQALQSEVSQCAARRTTGALGAVRRRARCVSAQFVRRVALVAAIARWSAPLNDCAQGR